MMNIDGATALNPNYWGSLSRKAQSALRGNGLHDGYSEKELVAVSAVRPC